MDKALDFYPLVLLRNAHTGGNSRERRDIRPDDRSKLKHHAWDVGGLRFTSTTTSLAFAEGRQRISNVEHTMAARAQYVVTTVTLETQHGLPFLSTCYASSLHHGPPRATPLSNATVCSLVENLTPTSCTTKP